RARSWCQRAKKLSENRPNPLFFQCFRWGAARSRIVSKPQAALPAAASAVRPRAAGRLQLGLQIPPPPAFPPGLEEVRPRLALDVPAGFADRGDQLCLDTGPGDGADQLPVPEAGRTRTNPDTRGSHPKPRAPDFQDEVVAFPADAQGRAARGQAVDE